jgi:hypothetical protein
MRRFISKEMKKNANAAPRDGINYKSFKVFYVESLKLKRADY